MLNLHYLRFFLSHIFCIFKTGVITLQRSRTEERKNLNRKQNIQMTKQTFRRICLLCIAIFPILAYASENSRDAAPQRPMDAAFLSFRPTDYYTTAVPALSFRPLANQDQLTLRRRIDALC